MKYILANHSKKISYNTLVIAGLLFLLIGCGPSSRHSETDKDGWSLLFDGKTLDGWHIYNQGKVESKWTVSNGTLICDPHKKDGVYGDLITDEVFDNFELELEWKVSKGGNSGVFFNVKEDSSYAATFATGLEMQLLDNKNAEPRHQVDSTHWAGCLYGVACIGKNSAPSPYAQWNSSRIINKNGKVQFWLNDQLTFDRDIRTADFKALVASGAMKAYPDFAKFSSGRIALQNHTDSISFRNIKIRRI